MRNSIANVLIISFLISAASLFAADNSKEKTLLFFSAEWCTVCQVAHRDIKYDRKLSQIIKNYTIVDVDFEVDKDIVRGYNIKSVPTFIIFENGKEKKRLEGYRNINSLISFLK